MDGLPPEQSLSNLQSEPRRLRVHSHLRTRDLCEARASRMIRPHPMHLGLTKSQPLWICAPCSEAYHLLKPARRGLRLELCVGRSARGRDDDRRAAQRI